MYKLLLGIRYFRSRFLTLASLLAITFGVAMLVIVLSIMGGYLVKLRESLRGQEADLQIIGPGQFGITRLGALEDRLQSIPGVTGTAPFVERLAVYHSGLSFQPILLKAIDPVRQTRVGRFSHFVLRPGELEDALGPLDEPAPPGPGKAEGDERAQEVMRAVHTTIEAPSRSDLSREEVLHLFSREWREEVLRRTDPLRYRELDGDIPPACLVGIHLLTGGELALGDIVTVVTMNPDPRNQVPLDKEFVVTGAVMTGDFDQDSGAIHAELSLVKNWLPLWDRSTGRYRYQGVRLAIADRERLESMRERVQGAIGPDFPSYEVKTWKDLRQNLLRAVRIEKFLVYFIVLVLVFFTGSMILLMLLLTVIEKTRDVGVLLSLGATPSGVSSIFLWNGLAICVAGTLLGLGLGVVFCDHVNDIHDAIHRLTGVKLFNPEVYHMDRIPIAFQPLDIFLSTVPPVLIGFLASLIPALWAPRRDPVRAIQYE